MCTDEIENLASITTHPSLNQRLQNSQQHGRGQGPHSLLEWVMATICMVWADAGDVLDTVSKWQSYVDLVQILQEIGMCQTIFNPDTHGPSDERFTARMRDLVQQHVSSASFGSLIAILARMSA